MSALDVVAELQRLGMSGYEAKAYVALLGEGEPMNGYAVAKRSGVPRSTVYETLGKLVARGAAFEVRDDEGSTAYVPLPGATLLSRLRRDFEESLSRLDGAIEQVAVRPRVHMVHTVIGPDAVLARAADIIDAAREDLYLSIWPDESDPLVPYVEAAVARGVTVTTLAFDEAPEGAGAVFAHRFSAPSTVHARVGFRLFAVAADRREVLLGGALEQDVWGVYSDDPVMVLVAVEYIRHDIAMQVLVDRIGADEVESFWDDDPVLARLRRGHGAPDLDRRARSR